MDWIKAKDLEYIFDVDRDTVVDWLNRRVFTGRKYGGVFEVRNSDVAIVLVKGNALYPDRPKGEWPELIEGRDGGKQL